MPGEPIKIAETTISLTPANTTENSLLSNANGSGKRYKVTSLLAANLDTANAHGASATRHTAAALGGTATDIAHVIQVPAEATLVLIDESTPINLPPNSSLGVTSQSANNIAYTLTYETYLGS